MEVAGVPGVAAGIVTADGLAWRRLEGVVDAGGRQPVTAQTMFPAASLGKPIFAHLALHLADQGKLDLDKPLKSYVSDHAPADARGDAITARHVLSHSSGLRNWRGNAAQALVPDFDPGSRFQYSGEGFYYLQRVIETITGQGFEQAVQERLFTPFGMASSTYAWRDDVESRLWSGHSRGNPQRQVQREFANRLLEYATAKGKPLATFTHTDIVAAMGELRPAPPALPNFIIPNAAGSLLTTLDDYAAFLRQLLNPGGSAVPLRPATIEAMRSPRTRINRVLSWGLGWGVEEIDGGSFLWHWGDNNVFRNFVLVHHPSRSAVVVFTNGQHGMRVAEYIVEAASGQTHLAFDWL